MALTPSSTTASVSSKDSNNYTFPLILVTSLFLLWGLAYGLLDVLNKHFQEALNITKSRSTLLQAAYFGAYFLIALPAGLFMNKFGYKKGILLGLLLYAFGAFLFYPSAQTASFNFFLVALFILASGLTCLETAANPYVTVLGKPETSEFRLNLSQCFNGVGSFIGPIIAAHVFFGESSANDPTNLDSVKMVYIIIAIVVLFVAFLFWRTYLPEIKEEKTGDSLLNSLPGAATGTQKSLFQHSHFVYGVIAQFFYVAAQVGVAALFINYCTEAKSEIDNAKAAYLLSISLALFTAGRFVGTALMRKIAPNILLTIFALVNIVLCAVVVWGSDWLSVYSLMAVFFFESIMFPTIFALGVKDLGHHTKRGSSFQIMSIVGGALMPFVMGLLADKGTAHSYIVPLLCFVVVAWYGWRGYRVK
ncbi:L-fucose:H+ symporter permease [Terrimonas sp.]|uniref:L-fucose:H+ symporter permease n=1 Tax=Terrimonas sp. TaxID=1914338 RepID=UPI000D50E924|nr:L-fucose:H+ symporter permease [Terrimonas sp.]PVD52634.1 L-fucose:H+ symporter permease [Terrimonas sp.]